MVRPIDMQDNLAKTRGAERVNQIQKAAPEIDQRHAAQVAQEEQVKKQQETKQLERTDEAVIHRDKGKPEDEQQDKDKKKKEKKKRNQSGLDVTA
jgi:hypothetical protein